MAVVEFSSRPSFNYQDLHLKLDFKRRLCWVHGPWCSRARNTNCSRCWLRTPVRQCHDRFCSNACGAMITISGPTRSRRTSTTCAEELGSYGEQYIESIFRIGYRFQPITSGAVHSSPLPQEPFYRPVGNSRHPSCALEFLRRDSFSACGLVVVIGTKRDSWGTPRPPLTAVQP
jgi:hypothetical protein